MWTYEKKLQFPVKIKTPNPAMAKLIITQLGGPDGELAASMRYLNQRYAMPYDKVKAMLTDVGTEELAHLEMIGAIVHQLTRNLNIDQIKEAGFDAYFVDHTTGVYPQAAAGFPFTTAVLQSKGDPITDLMEDWAAEQKARTTYDNLIRLVDDPDVLEPLRFLRQREIVHFQRFGESLEEVRRYLDSRNFYAINPAFDKAPVNIGEYDCGAPTISCREDGRQAEEYSDDRYAEGCACAPGISPRNNADTSYGSDCAVECGNSCGCATVDPPMGPGPVRPPHHDRDCDCGNSAPTDCGCRTNAGEDIPIFGDGTCCKKKTKR